MLNCLNFNPYNIRSVRRKVQDFIKMSTLTSWAFEQRTYNTLKRMVLEIILRTRFLLPKGSVEASATGWVLSPPHSATRRFLLLVLHQLFHHHSVSNIQHFMSLRPLSSALHGWPQSLRACHFCTVWGDLLKKLLFYGPICLKFGTYT